MPDRSTEAESFTPGRKQVAPANAGAATPLARDPYIAPGYPVTLDIPTPKGENIGVTLAAICAHFPEKEMADPAPFVLLFLHGDALRLTEDPAIYLHCEHSDRPGVKVLDGRVHCAGIAPSGQERLGISANAVRAFAEPRHGTTRRLRACASSRMRFSSNRGRPGDRWLTRLFSSGRRPIPRRRRPDGMGGGHCQRQYRRPAGDGLTPGQSALYRHQSDRAQRIANAYADAYVASNLDKRFEANSYAKIFLEDQSKQLKLRLEESENALLEFAEREKIVQVTDKASFAENNLSSANAVARTTGLGAGQERTILAAGRERHRHQSFATDVERRHRRSARAEKRAEARL